MSSGSGFHSDEHERNFRAANVRAQRGGVDEVVCGAQIRTGGTCRQKPLKGHKRCLRHAGPHAARAFRERQVRALARGKITPREFAEQETRRAMNRLRDQWKKRPWLPGRTIDLGEHEWAFLQETGLSSRPGPVAPAVLDWLRWKYRRLQIDRKRDNEWVRVLHDDLPGRLRAAGSPSDNESAALEQTRAQHAFVPWTVDNETLPTFSRRKQVDAPRLARAKPDHPFGSTGKRGRPRRLAQPSPEAVAELCYRHHKLLNRLFDKCRDQGEKSAVIAALSEYEANPMDPKVVGRWANLVRELNEPGR